MTARPRKATQSTLPVVKSGDYVLAGGSRASLPSDWFMAPVVWADAETVLVRRSSAAFGGAFTQVLEIAAIRAVGPPSDLSDLKRKASDAVRELANAVHDAESALGRARDAVWKKVGELAEAGMMVFPHDVAVEEASRTKHRSTLEAIEAEHEAGRVDELAR